VPAAVRKDAGVTQRELARRLQRAHSYVSRIEMGDRQLDVPEMIQWCEVLDSGPVDVMKRIMRRSPD
jgi:transcriptional regulator with XRE-family HTH domain